MLLLGPEQGSCEGLHELLCQLTEGTFNISLPDLPLSLV